MSERGDQIFVPDEVTKRFPFAPPKAITFNSTNPHMRLLELVSAIDAEASKLGAAAQSRIAMQLDHITNYLHSRIGG